MITGVHALIYSRKAEAVREFLRDKVGWPSVDAGGGWQIFALPPAEVAVHPGDGETTHELFLMCDDIEATVAELQVKGVEFVGAVQSARFGRLATIALPDGSQLGIYEPSHPLAARG